LVSEAVWTHTCHHRMPLQELSLMTAAKTGIDGVINPQPVAAPLTRSAIFLVVTINPGPDHRSTVRSFCADLPALFRAVEFRNLEAGLIPPPKRLESRVSW
jgi:hypothetical protein